MNEFSRVLTTLANKRDDLKKEKRKKILENTKLLIYLFVTFLKVSGNRRKFLINLIAFINNNVSIYA